MVIDYKVKKAIHDNYFTNETDINLNFTSNHHVTSEKQNALYTDPYYGL